jgi:hypothetical protein
MKVGRIRKKKPGLRAIAVRGGRPSLHTRFRPDHSPALATERVQIRKE